MTAVMEEVKDVGEDGVDLAQQAVQQAVEEANALRRRVIDGDGDVTGSDLAEADARIELAKLRYRAAQEIRDRALRERYEREQKAFRKRVDSLRKRREGKLDDLADKVGEVTAALIAEAATYEQERAELAGMADYYEVADVPPSTKPVRTILTHVGNALAAHPAAHRSGLASEVRNLSFRVAE